MFEGEAQSSLVVCPEGAIPTSVSVCPRFEPKSTGAAAAFNRYCYDRVMYCESACCMVSLPHDVP